MGAGISVGGHGQATLSLGLGRGRVNLFAAG